MVAARPPLEATTSTPAPQCPMRKIGSADAAGPALVPAEQQQTWVVRSFELGRRVLRESDSVRQAGFGTDQMERQAGRMRPPILYLEGAQHRLHRKAAARLFAPKVIEDYRPMMEALSEQLVGRLRADRAVDLSELSLQMAVEVAGRVVGLTESSTAGMSRRLEAFFSGDFGGARVSPRSLLRKLRINTALLRFFYRDVKPAIRSRRRQPREDVISQLLDSGFSDPEILTECVTYGAAGMATTREFLVVAAWHLLDSPDLLARYRTAGTEERVGILQEILRLEPVIGHLYRRTTAPVTLPTPDGDQHLPVGALLSLDIQAINADPSTAGADPLSLCPGRRLPPSVPPTLLAFGDGNHKCPGGPLALMESEIFLTALLQRDIVAGGPPRIRENAVAGGYTLDRFMVRLRS